ncbi:peptide ABC transporter permease [Sulfolobales archaeon HS-7]|nr:peptide ABC transporter permease [Sulfolobales archaeon HS-7]
MTSFLSYALKRFIDRFILLIGLIVFNWLLLEGLPEAFGINPVVWIVPRELSHNVNAYATQIKTLTVLFGFNQPLYVQFVRYVYNTLTFHFGYDFLANEPVIVEIIHHLPYTLVLTIPPLIISTFLAIILGQIAALRRGSAVDNTLSNYFIIQYNIPGFFLSFILWVVLIVALKLGPISDASVLTSWNIVNVLKAYWLPWIIITLIFGFPVRGLLMRNTMVDILDSDFIRYERIAGVKEGIVRSHARQVSLIPVVTRTSIDLAFILGGIFVIEYVFGIPGMGYLLTEAAVKFDFPLLVGSFFVLTFYSLIVLYINDLIYPLIDPRLKKSLR